MNELPNVVIFAGIAQIFTKSYNSFTISNYFPAGWMLHAERNATTPGEILGIKTQRCWGRIMNIQLHRILAERQERLLWLKNYAVD